MSIKTKHQEAIVFLERADRELEISDYIKASEYMWLGAASAVEAEMWRRGDARSDRGAMNEIVEALSDEISDESLDNLFAIAEAMYFNSKEGCFEEWQISGWRSDVHRFVSKMIEVTNRLHRAES